MKFMGHVIANYPNAKHCQAIIKTMVEAGVEFIEIQIPFSEPIADGPTFMAANQRALENGVSIDQSFQLMRQVSKQYQKKVAFFFMTYANIVYRCGFKQFVKRAKAAGAKGAIVPDLNFEMAGEFDTACREFDFYQIPVIPPNISDLRLKRICAQGSGFIYAVARHGVTGSKTNFGDELSQFLQRIRAERNDLPIAVGFGIRSRADVEFLRDKAEIVVIGSKSLEVFEEKGIGGLKKFWKDVAKLPSS